MKKEPPWRVCGYWHWCYHGDSHLVAMAAEDGSRGERGWVSGSMGTRVYNAWKKGADSLWRYLDGDGVMATNCWSGHGLLRGLETVSCIPKWLKVTNDGGSTVVLLRQQRRAIKDTWKKINDKVYHFDGDGKLKSDGFLDDMYYCGEDGLCTDGLAEAGNRQMAIITTTTA